MWQSETEPNLQAIIFHGWFDSIHRNHIKIQGSLRSIHIRGWLQQQTAIWTVIILLFKRVQEWSFVPQTTLILTSVCILTSMKIQTHQFSFGERSCGWQDHYSQGIMMWEVKRFLESCKSRLQTHNEGAGSAHLGCWHPRLHLDSALSCSTNTTCCPKRQWTSHLWKCPRPRVSYAHTDIYIIKHATSISKQNRNFRGPSQSKYVSTAALLACRVLKLLLLSLKLNSSEKEKKIPVF